MIGQYLSNTNEKATVSILQNILELNKPQNKCKNMQQVCEHKMLASNPVIKSIKYNKVAIIVKSTVTKQNNHTQMVVAPASDRTAQIRGHLVPDPTGHARSSDS